MAQSPAVERVLVIGQCKDLLGTITVVIVYVHIFAMTDIKVILGVLTAHRVPVAVVVHALDNHNAEASLAETAHGEYGRAVTAAPAA